MAEAKLAKYKVKRTTFIAQQQRIQEFVNNMSSKTSIEELETRLSALQKCYDGFVLVQSAIEEVDEAELKLDIRAEFEEAYFSIKPAILVAVNERKRDINERFNNTSITEAQGSGLKLPKIVLPSFRGDYTQWLSFYETYNTLVHDNSSLDKISKFHYLRSSLKEGALRTIQSIELSADNYDNALKLLKQRYDNRRLIAEEHIRQLFSLPKVMKASASGLRELIDGVNMHLRSLAALGRPTLQWDDLIVFLILTKLDPSITDKWEDECPSDRLPTLEEFQRFLEKRCHSLEGKAQMSKPQQVVPPLGNKSNPKLTKHTSLKVTQNQTCSYCSIQNHTIYKCIKFLNLGPLDRYKAVMELNLCVNCLKGGHTNLKCTSRKCYLCSQPHHTLLHNINSQRSQGSNSSDINPQPSMRSREQIESNDLTQISSFHSSRNENRSQIYKRPSQVLLATVILHIPNKCGTLVPCRALLDSGSQLNFISERLAQELGIKRIKTHVPIHGIGKTEVISHYKVPVTLKSRVNNFTVEIDAHILPKISEFQPNSFFNIEDWPEIPSNIELADLSFNKPQRIDLLIGAEIYPNLLLQEHLIMSENLPILQRTVFGWIVMGKVHTQLSSVQCNLAMSCSTSSLEKQVHQFWELERHDCPVEVYTPEEQLCESFFKQTTTRTETGQYCVRLPFRSDPEMLGESKEIASRRFFILERKFVRNSELKESYARFLNEYESLSHMQEIANDEVPTSNYFLPHHSVQKLDSSTTQLRVVFDASSKTKSGSSLNDILMVGPTVQPDLFSIIVNFRIPRFVFTCDISKMYRQILMHPEDRKYQLIVWRDFPNQKLKTYQLNTVTYGTSAAPYLATRCLKQLSCDEHSSYPKACNVLKNSVYVDDCMTGCDSLEEADKLQADLITVLKKGNFELRKFCANHPSLLSQIPEEHKEKYLRIHDNEVVKTLGLIWQPTEDVFQFHIAPISNEVTRITKRVVLSDVAKIFDPLGLISPIVVLGKIFLQQLWKLDLTWDEELPQEYSLSWYSYRNQLKGLNSLQIPRHMLCKNAKINSQLHAFSDSSEVAYGAGCYLRTVDTDANICVRLICSKSRVAPLKVTSLPRLELCAALLMVELVERLHNILQIDLQSITYYTDSSIVLSWLQSPSYSWSTFIANRIAKMQDKTCIEQWKHIPSKLNPADLISRGTPPDNLYNNSMWFEGPAFLSTPERNWPVLSKPLLDELPERRVHKSVLISSVMVTDLTEAVRHNNSFSKLQRIFAYCYRFFLNMKMPKESHNVGPLTLQELDSGLQGLILSVQRISFSKEIKTLKIHGEVDKSSRLRSLCPFLDTNGIIRIGGRLKNSLIPFDCKHQIVLPKDHCFTKLLLSYLHVKNLHAAPQTLLTICRQRYWPLDGRNLARHVVHQCIRCFRSKPKFTEQLMGDLPKERVRPGRPFLTTGIDFCGPFKIYINLRRKIPVKVYVAVFVCFTTKAIHLELVSDLSSEAFIAALRRFIARRGLCSTILCDNATNFVGARTELSELHSMFQSKTSQEMIQSFTQEHHIEWKPIPPRSPHFGGLWEAAVKAAKHHLVRTVSNASLTYEEMNTVIIQVEAILNSRPLTQLSSDPNDLEPLTPGHFIIGAPMTSFPEPDLKSHNFNRLSRFRRLQQIQQIFWQRWSMEYLTQLQQRHKWSSRGKSIPEGALVLMKEDNLPPFKWALGRVTKLYPGQDGVARVADVKTQFGQYRRSLVKLCPLPTEDDV